MMRITFSLAAALCATVLLSSACAVRSIPDTKKGIMDAFVAGKLDPSYAPAAFFIHFHNDQKVGDPAVQAHLNYFHESGMDILKVQFEQTVPRIRVGEEEAFEPIPEDFYRPTLDIITKSKMLSSYDGRAIAAWGSSIDKETGSDSRTRYAGGGTANFFSEDVVVSTNLMHNNQNIASTQSLRFLTTDSRPLTYSENSCAGADVTREWTKRTSGSR